MNYLTLPLMDGPVSVFDICQAHAQLESDYNVGGILRERPSNQRRNASTGVQLGRMKFNPGARWVDILTPKWFDDDGDNDVRDVYLYNVLKWGLPIDDEMRTLMALRYDKDFLNTFPSWSNT